MIWYRIFKWYQFLIYIIPNQFFNNNAWKSLVKLFSFIYSRNNKFNLISYPLDIINCRKGYKWWNVWPPTKYHILVTMCACWAGWFKDQFWAIFHLIQTQCPLKIYIFLLIASFLFSHFLYEYEYYSSNWMMLSTLWTSFEKDFFRLHTV